MVVDLVTDAEDLVRVPITFNAFLNDTNLVMFSMTKLGLILNSIGPDSKEN